MMKISIYKKICDAAQSFEFAIMTTPKLRLQNLSIFAKHRQLIHILSHGYILTKITEAGACKNNVWPVTY